MFTAQNYVMASSLEEAYTLNQKKANAILSGGCFLRLSKKRIHTLIDLSALSLEQIEEFDEEFRIGAMVTLRDVETNDALRASFGDGFYEMVRHIVGVQFRNCATIGGSLAARFGFSDILTFLLALDCEVELAHAGRMPLCEYAAMKPDRDVLVYLYVKKNGRRAVYQTVRQTKTDIPVLACAVSVLNGEYRAVVGARPARAMAVSFDPVDPDWISKTVDAFSFGSNMRASEEYRRHLAVVLLTRAYNAIREG